jgi:transcriptional regulator with XRE-family HTH domain
MDGRKLAAWNLRRLRVVRDLSQESLAVDADVDRTYVGRLERGLENPTVGVLDKLATALGVPISEFFVNPAPGESRPKPLPGGRRKITRTRERKATRSKHSK